jgi:cytochrome c5
MTNRRVILSSVLVLAAGALLFAGSSLGQQGGKPAPASAAGSAPVAVASQQDDEALRFEGEKRFHTNCGRCHQQPHKFPPRMMVTIERHMRVRATVTDEDVRLILRYMTQ